MVKLEKFINSCKTKLKKIERFIKSKHLKYLLYIKGNIVTRQLDKKLLGLIVYFGEICFTGAIIYYIITHFNFISLGLLSALIMYYIEWFVTLVKKKDKQE